MAAPRSSPPGRPRERRPAWSSLPSGSRADALAAAALVGAVALAFSNALGADFAYDDKDLIVENVYLREGHHLGRILTNDFAQLALKKGGLGPLQQIGYYRPTVALSYVIDFRFYGDSCPAGYHLTNLLLHALNVLLVYVVLRAPLRGRLVPFLAALLFAAHPVHTESVTWIAGRTDVMATTFALLALLFWTRARRRGGRRGPAFLALAFLAAVLSVFSKEVGATLPLALLLLEFARSRALGRPFPRATWGWAAVFALATLLYFQVRSLCGISASYPWKEPLPVLLATYVKAIGLYGAKCLYPVGLSIYPLVDFVRDAGDPTFWGAVAAIPAVLAPCGWLLVRRRNPWPFLGAAFFLAATAPLSNLIPLNRPPDVEFPFNERHIYLGSVGICLLIPAALAAFHPRAAAGAALLVLWHIPAARERNRDWRDDFSLFAATERTAPHSFVNWNNSAHAWQKRAIVLRGEKHEEEAEAALLEAERRFQESLRQARLKNVPLTVAMDNLAYNFTLRSRLEEFLLGKAPRFQPELVDEALSLYERQVRVLQSIPQSSRGDVAKAFNNLGAQMGNAGRAFEKVGQPVRALEFYRGAARCLGKALEAVPSYTEASFNLRLTLENLRRLEAAGVGAGGAGASAESAVAAARELAGRGEHLRAAETLERALLLGRTPALEGTLREVIEEGIAGLEAALARDPRSAEALAGLGAIYLKAGQHLDAAFLEKAVLRLEGALEVDPAHFPAAVSLGAARILQGRPGEARERYRAVARVLRERGEWMQAIDVLEQALGFGQDAGVERALRETIEGGIALFEGRVGRDPTGIEGANNLGAMYYKAGQHLDPAYLEKAERQFRRTLELQPSRVAAILNLGMTYVLLGRPEKARDLYQEALSRLPEGSPGRAELVRRLQERGGTGGGGR